MNTKNTDKLRIFLSLLTKYIVKITADMANNITEISKKIEWLLNINIVPSLLGVIGDNVTGLYKWVKRLIPDIGLHPGIYIKLKVILIIAITELISVITGNTVAFFIKSLLSF